MKKFLLMIAAAALLAACGQRAATDRIEPTARADAADEPQLTSGHWLMMSDGVELRAWLGGRGPLDANGNLPKRPVIAEFTTYGDIQTCCTEQAGPDFNYLVVQIRGTGASSGAFDTLGPRSQQDVKEALDWACVQPFSNGRIGLWGFSASAIMAYNSLHLNMPCLETAVLGAGTHDVYRDAQFPGGVPHTVEAAGVFAIFMGPTIPEMDDRLSHDPGSLAPMATGFAGLAADYATHQTLDEFWQQRSMRGDANNIPVLAINGFFDLEARGAFETFQELVGKGTNPAFPSHGRTGNGSHLYVVGAHDEPAAGSGGADVPRERWFRRFLLDEENGIDKEPAVQLWLADGDRTNRMYGDFVKAQGNTWPLEGTRWQTLYLDDAVSGSARSLNDGTLAPTPDDSPVEQNYVSLPSPPTAVDIYMLAYLDTPLMTAADGMESGLGWNPDSLDEMGIPWSQTRARYAQMDEAESLGLSYTTEALSDDLVTAGPASLELVLTSTVAETDVWAVISDVWPDGSVHPVSAGRLRTAYPHLVEGRSRTRNLDGETVIIQPHGDFSAKTPIEPGTEHRFFIEFWPIGNRFKKGHRLRLHVLGANAYNAPTTSGINTVRLGGPDGGSLLRIPVLQPSTLPEALSE